MLARLIEEYITCAEEAAAVDYGNKRSVREFNVRSARMREIVQEVVAMGQDAIGQFSSVLEIEPAAVWLAHHLVELAELDNKTLAKCFNRVMQAKSEAEGNGEHATAMGEDMWLKEWMARRS